MTPLLAAASSGDTSIIEWVIKHKATLVPAALHAACSAGHNDVVELLLQQGVSVSVKDAGGRSCLMHSSAGQRRKWDFLNIC